SRHDGVAKTYLAIAHGSPVPAEGRVETLIGRSPRDRKKMAVVDKNGKNAITLYRVAATDPGKGLSLVECRILTGRTHQIRVHLSSVLGCPIAGDATYGRAWMDKRLEPRPARQLLHAWKLSLRHPVTGKTMEFEAPPPPDFRKYGII
ncbi:MAG: RluA family pseudouridine synthase, partial [Kiritimatiellae bacterium]|nr:RluA family pseudouridine synthase [Kiritimatiellia bacterium]